MDAAENAVLDVRIVAHQTAQQDLDLLPLGSAAAIVTNGAGLGKAAGALDKFQLVIPPPGNDILLADAVHRADEGHVRKVCAVQLRRHSLQLGAVEHTHDRRLDDVIEVMPQRDFIAAKFLRLLVSVSYTHLDVYKRQKQETSTSTLGSVNGK